MVKTMLRHTVVFSGFLFTAFILNLNFDLPAAHAQEWVKSMFSVTKHDFGNVPRGAKSEFRFVLENKYEEDVHIADVRTSCKCTIPKCEDRTLKTYEKGEITCEFNTSAFVGPRSAVVTVVFDKPFYGEMQLMVAGNIRSDIVTEPGQIQFGEVPKGEERSTSVQITYAGDTNWEIKDVQSENQDLSVRLNRLPTSPGRVGYEMEVMLKPSAKPGNFNNEIVIVTNDSKFNLVTVPVRGSVMPPVVMPESIELGTIRNTGPLAKRMFIKGKEPFEIVKIECADPRFSFKSPEGARPAHIIPFEFDASKGKPGAFKTKVIVQTSIKSEGTAQTLVSGNVAE
ncbi:MAG: DUF1573 domain-containing protein [Pirellulaceae bacterium]